MLGLVMFTHSKSPLPHMNPDIVLQCKALRIAAGNCPLCDHVQREWCIWALCSCCLCDMSRRAPQPPEGGRRRSGALHRNIDFMESCTAASREGLGLLKVCWQWDARSTSPLLAKTETMFFLKCLRFTASCCCFDELCSHLGHPRCKVSQGRDACWCVSFRESGPPID